MTKTIASIRLNIGFQLNNFQIILERDWGIAEEMEQFFFLSRRGIYVGSFGLVSVLIL